MIVMSRITARSVPFFLLMSRKTNIQKACMHMVPRKRASVSRYQLIGNHAVLDTQPSAKKLESAFCEKASIG